MRISAARGSTYETPLAAGVRVRLAGREIRHVLYLDTIAGVVERVDVNEDGSFADDGKGNIRTARLCGTVELSFDGGWTWHTGRAADIAAFQTIGDLTFDCEGRA